MSKEEEVEKKSEMSGEVVEERIYIVPLSRAWIRPRTKRAPRAINLLKTFVKRHMKVEEESIRVAGEVNEKIWSRGIQKPPRKIRVKVTKDKEGLVTVYLAEGK
ncbi:MAG: 50S ribosomal protein L31e [Candidatus Bathyarchaeia archaeon]